MSRARRCVEIADVRLGRYQYDAAGNIKQIGTTAYTYDGVSRLREATPSGGNTETYNYDAFGNLRNTAPPGPKCTYVNGRFSCSYPSFLKIDPDPATNRLRGWTYDAAGNATSDGPGTFTWDGLGTMRSSVRSGNELRFLYNADDERVVLVERIASKNKTTFTLRGMDNQLLRTFVHDDTGATATWRWKDDNIWRGASLLANVTAAGTRHYALDHLGSPRAITTTSSAPVSWQDFTAFGLGGLAGAGSLMFTAHERDAAATGGGVAFPDYMHARYYSPNTGRFFSFDPHGFWELQLGNDADRAKFRGYLRAPQVWNRYAYVTNNPLKYTDPDGRDRYQEPGFTKPYSEWSEALDHNDMPPVIKASFYTQATLLSAAGGYGLYRLGAGIGTSIYGAYQAWRAASAAAATLKAVEQFSRGDARIFSAAMQLARGTANTFVNNLAALNQTVGRLIQGGGVLRIGYMNGQAVYGSPTTRIGITVIDGVTKIVRDTGDGWQILGNFR